eukprot:974200_1
MDQNEPSNQKGSKYKFFSSLFSIWVCDPIITSSFFLSFGIWVCDPMIIAIIQVIVCEKYEVSVLTFNVLEGKRALKNETFGVKVQEMLAESRPDILLFQEVNVHDNNVGDRSSSPMPFYGRHFQMFGDKEKGFIVQSVDRAEIELYFHIQSCAAERFPMLGNSIFASNSYLQRLAAEDLYQVVDSRTVVNITGSCTVPRCAAYALFGDGVSVVSVHLCGGRFDDAKILDTDESSYAVKQRTQVAKAKDKGLKELFAIKSSKPTIIGGDFNGIRNKELVQSALSSYGRYQTADEGNKKIFEDFYTSGFGVLKANDSIYVDSEMFHDSIYNNIEGMYSKPMKRTQEGSSQCDACIAQG